MRTNLVMNFHCFECGDILDIECKDRFVGKQIKNEVADPATGAACLRNELITVRPCRSCIEKYTLPAKQLCNAIKAMEENNDKQ